MTTVLVTGPEASGNRMLCRMLTEAGAEILHKPMPMSTHWRPGMPGNPTEWDGLWPDFAGWDWDAAVVITRDIYCATRAQVRAGHVPTFDKALDRTRRALVEIYRQLGDLDRPFWPVTYESLARPEALASLCAILGLDASQILTRWQDANAKHYGGPEWSDHRPLWQHAREPQLVVTTT